MKTQRIAEGIVRVTIHEQDLNLDEYAENLIYLESKGILTFGDTNFRVLEKYFRERGYDPESLDLCLDDDKSIGLEMPKTWYLNKGKHALSIAAYYTYLNFHGIVEHKDLSLFNEKISRDYGRVACIEVYLEKELIRYLDAHKIKYFGTPRTLTECVRYLEGWDLEKYPRLKGYATFSKFIEYWCRINFPNFNTEEWYLGKEKSNKINESGLTNVRKAVRFFWEQYLLNARKGKTSAEDVEIDIVGGDKFHKSRQPSLILLSEDLFSEDDSTCEIFTNLTKRLSKKSFYFSKRKNDFAERNARAARVLYPNALIVLLENDTVFQRNFSLINPVKQSINQDVVAATKVVRYFLESNLKIIQ